jgi:hypothetical protein
LLQKIDAVARCLSNELESLFEQIGCRPKTRRIGFRQLKRGKWKSTSMTMFIAGLATAYAIPLALLVMLLRKAPSL